jgi:serine/threonine protein kinase
MLRRIGIGAYGEVWMAASITGALRAVKVVRREHFDHDRTYEREFGGLKSFEPISRQHEGLVDILQIGRNDSAGYFYCVMELADNAGTADDYLSFTLAELIRTGGRMEIAECARTGASVAEALEFLHGRGLVHRDVKPSNIIFVNGQPKLADIGLVASVGSARSFVGTDGFIPPEGPGKPAADIYALGKTLYEMAVGRSRLDFPDLPRDLETKGDGVALVLFKEVIF